MAQPLDQFVKQLVLSTLLSEDDVAAFLAGMSRPPADGDTLARELVRQKKLTAFQAQQIYAGKGKSLVLGNYLLLDKLGQGGMGMVLKAVHQRMERMVALKVLSPAVVKTPEALRRFQREVKAAARLTHPNIVIAHDADEAGGTHFLVMEFVEGADLSSLVKKGGPLPLEKALACMIQAARGLEYAHTQGIVHRDIKPANLLLDSKGTIKILDMGLARLDSAGARQDDLTGTGQIMGTVDYMAPEQAANTKNADHRADIYSLGVTLWYLLSGKAMYDGETVIEKLLAHQSKPIPSLVGQAASLPGSDRLHELNAVFQRMVAKLPADRFQSMTEVIAALETCRTSGGTTPTVSLGPSDDSKLSNFLKGQGSAGTRGAKGTATAAKPATSPAFEETLNTSPPSVDTDPTTNLHLANPLLTAPATSAKQPVTKPARDNRQLILFGSIGAGVLSIAGIVAIVMFFVGRDDPSRVGPKKLPNRAPPAIASADKAVTAANDPLPVSADGWQSLFTSDLEGWRGRPGMWQVTGGMLIGDSSPDGVKGGNTYLVSPRTYRDFEMEYDLRMTVPASANSGLQIRSELIDPNQFVMSGPQVDCGTMFWGALYGEKMAGGILQAAAPAAITTVKRNEFNHFHVRAVGARVLIELNGVTSVDAEVPQLLAQGLLGFQMHAGPAFKLEVKNVRLRELDATGKPLEAGNAPSTSAAAGDLPSTAELAKLAISGDWQNDGGAIVSPVLPYAQLSLPGKFPPAYKLTLEVTREAGTGPLVLGLPVAGKRCMATIDNTPAAAVSATPPHEVTIGDLKVPAPVRYFPGLALGKPARIECRVSSSGIAITIDGQAVLVHESDLSSLSQATTPARWQTTDRNLPFVGASLSRFRITKLEVGSP